MEKCVQDIAEKLNITTEAVTKRLTSLSTQYCKVIKLVGCSFSRDHTVRSDSTQLNWL